MLVDGGSSDGTLELAQRHSARPDQLVLGKDRGIWDAFNLGVRAATGDWIAILNSDDWWEPETLESVEAALAADRQPRVIHGRCRFWDSRGSYLKIPVMNDMKKFMSAYHPTMFVHRGIYEQIGGYREEYQLAMDAEWTHRALSADVRFEALDAVLANMSMGGVSDREFLGALTEYRRSSLRHGIASRWEADAWFTLHLLVKLGYRIPGFYGLKRWIDRRTNPSVQYDG